MATYKQTRDHGGEFYRLVAKYGYEKDLRSNYVAIVKRIKEVVEYWRDDHHYELFKQVD